MAIQALPRVFTGEASMGRRERGGERRIRRFAECRLGDFRAVAATDGAAGTRKNLAPLLLITGKIQEHECIR